MLLHLVFCHQVGADGVQKDHKTQPDEMLSYFRHVQILQGQANTEDQQICHAYLFIPCHSLIIYLFVYKILFFFVIQILTTIR